MRLTGAVAIEQARRWKGFDCSTSQVSSDYLAIELQLRRSGSRVSSCG